MLLAHKIEIITNANADTFFRKASGCARFTWNWALAEWNRQYALGQKPNAMALKKQFNAIKHARFPWLLESPKDANQQPFTHLAKAWSRFFSDLKAGNKAYAPRFKRKGEHDSFYLSNDKFEIKEDRLRVPLLGWLKLRERLRFSGKIMGASISCESNGRWFVSIQVDAALDVDLDYDRGEIGIDLGVKDMAVLSDGRKLAAPKPLKKALRRLNRLQRANSRKEVAAKVAAGYAANKPLPKGVRLAASNNLKHGYAQVAKQHYRVACVRRDLQHKFTTSICRENQAIVIEDLNVSGMLKNRRLARSIADIGMGEIRRQLTYKAAMYGCELIVADRWFASSKTCSDCGYKLQNLKLSTRSWVCPECGSTHDRDINAAINLKNQIPRATREFTPISAIVDMIGAVGPVRVGTKVSEPHGSLLNTF